MKESTISQNLPYIVKAPWFVQMITAGLIPTAVWILFFSPLSPNEDPIIRWITFLIAGVVMPYFVLLVFLSKTVFRKDCIIHIGWFFVWKRILYKDIDSLKIVGNGDVKLNLIDGTSIQVLCGTDQQAQVINIIRSKVLCRLER